MITGYTDDYQFAASSAGTPAAPTYTDDTMLLPTGYAKYGINDVDGTGNTPATGATYSANVSDITVYVLTGAMQTAAVAASTLVAAAAVFA